MSKFCGLSDFSKWPVMASRVWKHMNGKSRTRWIRESRLRAPSRATVYKLMASLPCPKRRWCDLPPAAQAALYNLAPDSEVPLHQIAFNCFNYGDLDAASYAAGLPWLALYQAWRMRGHRPKSRGLLAAAMAARRI